MIKYFIDKTIADMGSGTK